jgi:hypothetical protein
LFLPKHPAIFRLPFFRFSFGSFARFFLFVRMMTGDCGGREVIIAEEVFVLWSVFYCGSAGQKKAEGLFTRGLSEGPEAECPAGVGGEESGIF